MNTHSLYEIIEECQVLYEQMIGCSRPKYFIFKETALAEKGSTTNRLSFTFFN